MPELPSGTVTFLFTDVEGSTRLLHESGPLIYTDELAAHRRVLRNAFTRHNGVEVDTQGDAFFVAFSDAADALSAAGEAQRGLAQGRIRVRMGIHTGEPQLTDEGYVGSDVHLGARICAAGHGGQVLMSRATRDLIAGSNAVLDLGEHRLKDFTNPVWIYQLGSERFPPLRTISNTNLPRPASSFVGREREVKDITAMLRDGARLLTLTGPGGAGKSRLALAAATELVPEFRSGVFWVPLASLRDPDLVSDSVARTLGAKDRLEDHIGEREMLLLIDNLEQVIAAAPEMASLVEACPNLRLLVTSRELLRVRGEVEYQVPPLADPEAAELFSARSGLSVDESVRELCRRLENLPLAVELAAARARVLSPNQVLQKLSDRLDLLKGGRDADPRQQTLRAAIEWSYDLLTTDEQRLFARLAVFRGGHSLEAAENVAGADLDALQSFVDKSLLRHSGERFWMLETIREFAAERLDASGSGHELGQRHAEFFLALAEAAEPHLLGGGSEQWHDRLELELDNFRAALEFLETAADIQLALRLSGALSEFWDQRAHHAELPRLERLLRADDHPTSARAKALSGIAVLTVKTGHPERAMELGSEALAIHRRLGDRRGQATALWEIGYLHTEQGDLGQAESCLDESVRLFREIGDTASLAWATRTLAFAHLRRGDLEVSQAYYQDALALARTGRDRVLEAAVLGVMARIALAQDRVREAASFAAASLDSLGDTGDRLVEDTRICSAASVLAGLGQDTIAAQLVGYADAQYEKLRAREPWVKRMNDETFARVSDELDEKSLASALSSGSRLTTEEALDIARKELRNHA